MQPDDSEKLRAEEEEEDEESQKGGGGQLSDEDFGDGFEMVVADISDLPFAKICSACGKRYRVDYSTCPRDDTELSALN